MAHINVPPGLPGIIGLLAYRPETAKPLNELAQILLRGESTLSEGERELIAAYVSHHNECYFCNSSHSAVAKVLLGERANIVDAVKTSLEAAPISEKLRALLRIAGKVQMDGREVTEDDIANARSHGATDREIHDSVLIAAAFCMYNRYVDGLGIWTPRESEVYEGIGQRLAKDGYVMV